MTTHAHPVRIILADELPSFVGISAETAMRLEREGDFPKRRRISPQRVGWLSTELEQWILERPTADEQPHSRVAGAAT